MPVGRYVDDEEPGLYRVLVARPDQWRASQRWLLITDLGAVAKQAPGEVLVWVSSTDSLAPVSRARVTLVSDQNQEIGAGWTDEQGLWRFRDADKLEQHRPYLLTIEKGGDFTFVMLDRMAIDTAGLDVGGAPPAGDGYTAYLYGERDLYRPGETLEGLAVVRDGRLQAAPAMPALLRHRDPRSLEIETRTVSVDRRGLAPFDLDLPAWALTGNHSLELEVGEKTIGTYGFQVEEFIPDRIKVEIDSGASTPGPGDLLEFDVASSYLFGPPAAALPVEARVRLATADFGAPGYENFSFRNSERQFSDREILESDGALDEQGRRTFSATIPSGLEVPSSLQAVITARVSEQGGRGVAARTAIDVHPYPYYIGLRRAGQGYGEPGKAAEFEFAAVTPGGDEVEAGELEAELYWIRWQTVLRRSASGSYRYETVREPLLAASQSLAEGQSRGRFSFTPDDYGRYRVVVTDSSTGASAAVEFWASGWGYSPWAMENPSRVEIDLDRDEYRPGETAVAQVRAPFSGRLLVTVEREKIFTTQIYTLDDNTATVRIPIRADFRPNAYVTATVVRSVSDLETGSVARAYGAVPLYVDRTANRQAVEITAPGEVRSESTTRGRGPCGSRLGGHDRGGRRGNSPVDCAGDSGPVRVLLPQAGTGSALVRHLQPPAPGSGSGRGLVGRRRNGRRRDGSICSHGGYSAGSAGRFLVGSGGCRQQRSRQVELRATGVSGRTSPDGGSSQRRRGRFLRASYPGKESTGDPSDGAEDPVLR